MTQAMEALQIANRVRFEAAQIKRDIASGKIDIRVAVHDRRCQACRVWNVINAIPRFGPMTSADAMRFLGIANPTIKVCELTSRQKSLLAIIDREVKKR